MPPCPGHVYKKKRGGERRGGGCPLGFVRKKGDQSGGEKKKIGGVHGHGHMPRKERGKCPPYPRVYPKGREKERGMVHGEKKVSCACMHSCTQAFG
jgi:hypothetical protein